MAAINIGGSSMDASYRYKMPPLQVKIEGRGNGIKTIVVNLFDVAKALHIHPAYPLKYFGIELGAQTKYTKATERCIVNGAHGGQDLAKLLTKFIDQFILCPTCKLPELKMSVGKRDLKITCDACGYSGVLNTPHKLAGYIQKNPPSVLDAKEEGGDDTKVAGRKLTKEERKAARAAKKGTKGDDNDEEGELEDDFDNLEVAEEEEKDEGEQRHRKQKKSGKKKSKSKEAAAEDDDAESASETEEERAERKRRKAEKKAKKAAKEAAAANGKAEKEDEWHTDVSKEAVRLRKEEERASMKGKVVNGDAEAEDEPAAAPLQVKELSNGYVTANNQSKSDIEAANLLRTFLQQKRSTDQTVAELKRLSLARGYDDSQRFLCLFNAICTPAEPKKLPSAMEKHAPVMRKLVGDSTQQVTILLNSVEHFLGEAWNAAFLLVTPHVLKSLYETDVLTEQQLIDWYDMPSDNPLLSAKNVSDLVRMKANVFIEWLKTADESEGEEEDD